MSMIDDWNEDHNDDIMNKIKEQDEYDMYLENEAERMDLERAEAEYFAMCEYEEYKRSLKDHIVDIGRELGVYELKLIVDDALTIVETEELKDENTDANDIPFSA